MREILDKLYSLQRRGIVPGLERVRTMLDRLGNPHQSLRAFHIAGTNGKGTVSSVMASILLEAGEQVGLYTSPHIRSFNERIRINGAPISDGELIELYRQVEQMADDVHATFFEITTVMALSKFHNSTSTCVLECGLGGRFDATNVVRPQIAIITSIDYDHREWLGDTLEKIAFEKAGIIKSDVSSIIGEPRAELRAIFQHRAQQVGAGEIFFLDDIEWRYEILEHRIEGMQVALKIGEWSCEKLFIPLHGEHQIRNVVIALLALQQYWKNHSEVHFDPAIVERGLRKLVINSGLRARIEVVRHDPLLVFDVAHNPAGCRALVQVIGKYPFPPQWNVVFGVMQDKDYREMLAILAPVTKRFFFAEPRTERARSSSDLLAAARELGIHANKYPQVSDALTSAIATGEPTICVGSFFTIDEAFDVLDELR
ncbi:MAG: bifunctional folylpolyglutamate synthase/dihydrofolate synthase [Chlorobi bacterium]|nr:bifunctional folylpolyglutamate synthase/dihydrofolate synthase [Chlorobiota bacterium]